MYDLAVIGGGPGGYVAAIKAAQQGLNVILIEQDFLGGTCLNRGCIPTKSFYYDAKLLKTAKASRVLNGGQQLSINPEKMLARKQKLVRSMVSGLEAIMKSNNIEVVSGTGRLEETGRVDLNQPDGTRRLIEARNIILATGSKPAIPSFVEVDGQYVQTTDEALNTADIPASLIIIGGGVIGLEMAAIFINLGTKVTVIELLSDLLITEDSEVRETVRRLMRKNRASLHLEAAVKEIEITDKTVTVGFEDTTGVLQNCSADKVLLAAGRVPVLDGIEPAKLGLKMNGPFVKVSHNLKTSLPGVYAVGDLVGGMMLAHKASAEAEVAVENIINGAVEFKADLVPRCMWSLAEIGAVGLTEKEARETQRQIKVGRFPLAASGAAKAIGNTDGFVKIVGDAENGEILGVHIVGERATDLISEAVTVMKMEGTVEDLYRAIKPHPTMGESVAEAALDWNDLVIHMPRK